MQGNSRTKNSYLKLFFFSFAFLSDCLHAENLVNIKEIKATQVKLKNRQLKSFGSTKMRSTVKFHMLKATWKEGGSS